MKISIVNTLYAPFGVGGAGRSVKELAEGLVDSGHQVQVLTLAPEPGSSQAALAMELEPVIHGVQVHRFENRASFEPFDNGAPDLSAARKLAWHLQEAARPAAYRFLSGALAEFQPDVVHTNNIAGFGMSAWHAARSYPLVHTMRDYYLACARSQLYRNGSLCKTRCTSCVAVKSVSRLERHRPDLYVGVSEDLVQRHRSLGLIAPSAQSAVVYNWPDVPRVNAPASPASDGPWRFGVLGRMGEDKGTWRIVEAFSRLPHDVKSRSTLTLVGYGSQGDTARLARMIESEPRIQYVGRHMSPTDFFATIDVAVIPSQWYEPFGRVAAEALLSGTAVLASAAGGLPEAVRHFGGGVLVEDFGSTEAWTDALAESIRTRPVAPVARTRRGDSPREQYLVAYARARRLKEGRHE